MLEYRNSQGTSRSYNVCIHIGDLSNEVKFKAPRNFTRFSPRQENSPPLMAWMKLPPHTQS